MKSPPVFQVTGATHASYHPIYRNYKLCLETIEIRVMNKYEYIVGLTKSQ